MLALTSSGIESGSRGAARRRQRPTGRAGRAGWPSGLLRRDRSGRSVWQAADGRCATGNGSVASILTGRVRFLQQSAAEVKQMRVMTQQFQRGKPQHSVGVGSGTCDGVRVSWVTDGTWSKARIRSPRTLPLEVAEGGRGPEEQLRGIHWRIPQSRGRRSTRRVPGSTAPRRVPESATLRSRSPSRRTMRSAASGPVAGAMTANSERPSRPMASEARPARLKQQADLVGDRSDLLVARLGRCPLSASGANTTQASGSRRRNASEPISCARRERPRMLYSPVPGSSRFSSRSSSTARLHWRKVPSLRRRDSPSSGWPRNSQAPAR